MTDHSERRRILDLLASGQINAEEAEELLGAVEAVDNGRAGAGRGVAEGAAVRGTAEVLGRGVRRPGTRRVAGSLRITIDTGGEDHGNRGRVAVSVPLALAKFASKLIPEDARTRLEDEGIELAELLQALDQELPEGRLIDIDTTPEGDSGRRARIIVEVV